MPSQKVNYKQQHNCDSSKRNWREKYIDSIKQFPLLTPEEMSQLFSEMKNGDSEARQKLINSNLRLAYFVAYRFHKNHINVVPYDLQDVIQEANIGLMKAVDRYDYSLGYTFATYAYHWILQTIQRALPHYNTGIYIPHLPYAMNAKIRSVEDKLYRELMRPPTASEVAEKMNISIIELSKIKKIPTFVSIDYQFHPDNDDSFSLLDVISDDDAFEEIDDVLNREYMTPEITNYLNKRLGNSIITDEERAIIKMHFGIGQKRPMTFRDIALVRPYSRQRAFQTFKKGMNKLKLICSNEKFPYELFNS